MATISDRRTAGGKITRSRRAPASSRTPYSRPEKAPAAEDPENPNWLSGLIYPAKLIASGAGKIISFFGPNSSTSSSSDGDSSGNGDDDEYDEEVSFQGYDQLDKVPSSSCKSENKRAIEQLVIQETFSREEGNELIKLVQSRIMDGNIDENAAHMHTTTIMEARKWLQEKRSGSKKFESKFDISKLATSSQFSRNEKGSPVDMAKSYMQNRPAWASPSLKHVTEVGSPSPLPMQPFKDETPKLSLRSSELKRGSLTSGSWNILDEIRRVRSKATEELLSASPLTKISASSFPQNNPRQNSMTENTNTVVGDLEESSLARTQDVLLEAAAMLPSRVNQDGDAIQSMERQEEQKAADTKSNEDNGVNEPRNTMAENGSIIVSSLPAGGDATTPKLSGEVNGDMDDSSHDVHVVDPTTDVLTPGPSNTAINGSQNSSRIQHEELSQESEQPNVDPQKGRKSRGYSRRGRGKAK